MLPVICRTLDQGWNGLCILGGSEFRCSLRRSHCLGRFVIRSCWGDITLCSRCPWPGGSHGTPEGIPVSTPCVCFMCAVGVRVAHGYLVPHILQRRGESWGREAVFLRCERHVGAASLTILSLHRRRSVWPASMGPGRGPPPAPPQHTADAAGRPRARILIPCLLQPWGAVFMSVCRCVCSRPVWLCLTCGEFFVSHVCIQEGTM